MVVHIIARGLWQGIQPHVGRAAQHAARGIQAFLTNGPTPTKVLPVPLPTGLPGTGLATGLPGTGLPNLATSQLIEKLAVPAAAAPAGVAIARHGQVVHRAVRPAASAGGVAHGVRSFAEKAGTDFVADAVARPVEGYVAKKVRQAKQARQADADDGGAPEPGPTAD
jgi:hypothetical protein